MGVDLSLLCCRRYLMKCPGKKLSSLLFSAETLCRWCTFSSFAAVTSFSGISGKLDFRISFLLLLGNGAPFFFFQKRPFCGGARGKGRRRRDRKWHFSSLSRNTKQPLNSLPFGPPLPSSKIFYGGFAPPLRSYTLSPSAETKIGRGRRGQKRELGGGRKGGILSTSLPVRPSFRGDWGQRADCFSRLQEQYT